MSEAVPAQWVRRSAGRFAGVAACYAVYARFMMSMTLVTVVVQLAAAPCLPRCKGRQAAAGHRSRVRGTAIKSCGLYSCALALSAYRRPEPAKPETG